MLTHQQYGRQLTPDSRMGRSGDPGRRAKCSSPHCSLYHVFALQVNGFVPLMIGASKVLMIANPRDIPALVKALRRTCRSRRYLASNYAVQRVAEQQGLRCRSSTSPVCILAIGGGMAVQRAAAERWQSTTGKP